MFTINHVTYTPRFSEINDRISGALKDQNTSFTGISRNTQMYLSDSLNGSFLFHEQGSYSGVFHEYMTSVKLAHHS